MAAAPARGMPLLVGRVVTAATIRSDVSFGRPGESQRRR